MTTKLYSIVDSMELSQPHCAPPSLVRTPHHRPPARPPSAARWPAHPRLRTPACHTARPRPCLSRAQPPLQTAHVFTSAASDLHCRPPPPLLERSPPPRDTPAPYLHYRLPLLERRPLPHDTPAPATRFTICSTSPATYKVYL
jgi:hypothetical protein